MRQSWASWLLAGALMVPHGAVVVSPGGSIITSIPQRSGYYTTPASLTGQVVCARGRVQDVKLPEERALWFDGETGDPRLAGWRCVKFD
jgi:hypothetical protein